MHQRVCSLVPRPLERPGNEASVCSAAVAVVTNIIIMCALLSHKESKMYKLTPGTTGGDMI